jgi:UMF1 family MFS transporter
LAQLSWASYEWARNPYVILVTIYFFAPYFTTTVVGDPIRGQALWGYVNGVAGFIIAILGPIAVAIPDKGGVRKPWLLAFTLTLAASAFCLWFAVPNMSDNGIWIVLAIVFVASASFELTAVFHNSMLPSVVPESRLGLISGLGLALGNGARVFFVCLYALCLCLTGRG